MKNFLLFKGKKVLITGHTGFKGSWLVAFLHSFGAKIIGISNGFVSIPSHYKLLKLEKKINSKDLDIRNLKLLKKFIKLQQPDFIFHLAAQSLVKKSYKDPLKTWSTNTFGTINILESLRLIKKKCIVVLITSDKAYENLEIKRGYKENDRLGGKDPYSASKAAADISISSYINSFFSHKDNNVFIATARAGNVIGGGDWSSDRLIPDCVRSWSKNKTVLLRSPKSTRPWQHVLEVVYGYILLASKLHKNRKLHGQIFNFGPANNQNYTVISLVRLMKKFWVNVSWKIINKQYLFKESALLKLNSKKARKSLNWKPVLSFKENMFLVTNWYKNFYSNNSKIQELTFDQIEYYKNKLKKNK